jgi:hypothetical protein
MKKKVVRKKSRLEEYFSERKYKASLKKSGLPWGKCSEIFNEVVPKLNDYFSTAELHNKTYRAILKRSQVFAANYDIKRAIYNLGPTGFPFEKLCGEMLKAKGYKVRVSVLKKGKLVKHEVDVIAEREDNSIYCECKFHNKKVRKNDIKIPLYVNSRYLDLKEANPGETFQYAIISNTEFTTDAIKYSEGEGLLLFSMNYPKQNSFIDLIRRYKVYPITVLKSLKSRTKKQLIKSGVIVIKQVKLKQLLSFGMEEYEAEKVMQEVKVLTRPN